MSFDLHMNKYGTTSFTPEQNRQFANKGYVEFDKHHFYAKDYKTAAAMQNQIAHQPTHGDMWGGGIGGGSDSITHGAAIFYPPNGPNGPGGPNGPNAGDTGLGGPADGSPAYLDRRSEMNYAQAEAQTSLDNANKSARARAAAMGLDYNPNASDVAVNQALVSTQANNAGMKTDIFNMDTYNKFELEKIRQGYQDRRTMAQLAMEDKQMQQRQAALDAERADRLNELHRERADRRAEAREAKKYAGIYFDEKSGTFKNMNDDPSFKNALKSGSHKLNLLGDDPTRSSVSSRPTVSPKEVNTPVSADPNDDVFVLGRDKFDSKVPNKTKVNKNNSNLVGDNSVDYWNISHNKKKYVNGDMVDLKTAIARDKKIKERLSHSRSVNKNVNNSNQSYNPFDTTNSTPEQRSNIAYMKKLRKTNPDAWDVLVNEEVDRVLNPYRRGAKSYGRRKKIDYYMNI